MFSTPSILLTALAAAAESAAPAIQPIRDIQQCLDASRAYDWQKLDDFSIAVAQGKQRFRLTFSGECNGLATAGTIQFKGSVGGRLCGNPSEAVIVRGETCRVLRVEPLSIEEYKDLLSGERRK